MSADRCPVCGDTKKRKWKGYREETAFFFGCDAYHDGSECIHAERLAISRAAEIERLRRIIQELETKLNKGD